MFAYPLIFKNAVPPSKKHICRKLNGSSSTPKNFLHKGPKKKKTKPNPKLPVRGTSAEAEPVTGFWFWFWSWALGNGLRPACLPGTMEFKACTAKKQKNKRERERERSKQSFCCLYKFWIQSSIEKLNGKEEWSAECSYSFLHRHRHTQRHTRAVVCVLYDFLFLFY